MGVIRAGDIRQITINGREFDPAAESNWTIRLGGFDNEIALTGNGNAHVTQRRQTAGIGDCNLSIDSENQDLEFIEEIKDDGEFVPVNMTLVNGTTYSGSLGVVGELSHNTGDGTLTLELRGSTFEQI